MPPDASESAPAVAPDEPIPLHTLTYLDEGDEVTVGRRDIDSYVVLPADGAALLRQLEGGMTPHAVAQWYEQTYGESVDVADFVSDLHSLGFVNDEPGDSTARPVRWQRLGRAVYSPVGFACLGALVIAALAAMVLHPALVPGYQQIFFTKYLSILELVTFLGQFPLILIHEAAHALAGRRLGLRSTLSLGHRLYYITLVTSLDGLVTVPRRKRFLPMLAGVLADIAVACVLTLIAWLTIGGDGRLPLAGQLCTAFAMLTLLRIAWQFYFYLQTDLYYIAVTVLGCVDLQAVAKQLLRLRLANLLHRDSPISPSSWHPRDRAVARWYSWLMLAGYTFSIAIVLVVAVPAFIRVVTLIADGLGPGGSAAHMVDIAFFLALNLVQLLILGYLIARGRRRARPVAA